VKVPARIRPAEAMAGGRNAMAPALYFGGRL
jgi:hypothetical protein